jgi:DNA-binding CsgD family transcriptional regulator
MNSLTNLTGRELEILQLIAEGLTDKRIAEELSISNKTASTHRKRMLKKMNVKNTAMMIRHALEFNLIK